MATASAPVAGVAKASGLDDEERPHLHVLIEAWVLVQPVTLSRWMSAFGLTRDPVGKGSIGG